MIHDGERWMRMHLDNVLQYIQYSEHSISQKHNGNPPHSRQIPILKKKKTNHVSTGWVTPLMDKLLRSMMSLTQSKSWVANVESPEQVTLMYIFFGRLQFQMLELRLNV